MTRALVLASLLLAACGPDAPTITFEDVSMDATGLSFVTRTTPGARLTCGPAFEPQHADATGLAHWALPLAEVTQPEYRFMAEVEGTFGTAFGYAILTPPMAADAAGMVRPDGSPALAVDVLSAAELGERSACRIGGDFGAGNVAVGASGRCGFTFRVPAGTTVTFDGAPVETTAPFEVDFAPQVAALTATMFGIRGDLERTYAVALTSASGATTSGSIVVSTPLLGDALRSYVGTRSGVAFVDGGTPDPALALLVGPASAARLVGHDVPAGVAGAVSSVSRVAVATDGATREAPPCTGYTVEGGGAGGSLARVTTDVELVVYDAATMRELGRTTVAGPGTGCPTVADGDDLVHDRPTTEALAAAIWAAGS